MKLFYLMVNSLQVRERVRKIDTKSVMLTMSR